VNDCEGGIRSQNRIGIGHSMGHRACFHLASLLLGHYASLSFVVRGRSQRSEDGGKKTKERFY